MLSNSSLVGRELLIYYSLLLDLCCNLGYIITRIVVVLYVSKTSNLVLYLSIKIGTLEFVIKNKRSNIRDI